MWKKRCDGRLWLLAILILLSCSCAARESSFGYKVTMPMLEVEPKVGACHVQDPEGLPFLQDECTTILSRDYQKILVELVAACLAFGGTDDECLGGH